MTGGTLQQRIDALPLAAWEGQVGAISGRDWFCSRAARGQGALSPSELEGVPGFSSPGVTPCKPAGEVAQVLGGAGFADGVYVGSQEVLDPCALRCLLSLTLPTTTSGRVWPSSQGSQRSNRAVGEGWHGP